MDKIIFLCLICFSFTKLFSQEDSFKKNIVSYNENLIVGLSINSTSDVFYNQIDDGENLFYASFSPVIKKNLNANFTYKLIDFSLGFAPNFLNKNNDEKRAKNFNLGFRFYHKKWVQSLSFVKQKGFYVGLNDQTFFYPNLKTLKIGGTTSYVFNDMFSFKTIFNQTEWQKKSAGSFIPNFSFYYTNIKSQTESDDLNSDIYTLTISPSYYYNLILFDRFIIGGGLNLGTGLNLTKEAIDPIFELSYNFKIGYNIKSFFISLGNNNSSFFFIRKNEIYDNSLNSVRLEIGYRLNPPKKFKEVYDKVLN